MNLNIRFMYLVFVFFSDDRWNWLLTKFLKLNSMETFVVHNGSTWFEQDCFLSRICVVS